MLESKIIEVPLIQIEDSELTQVRIKLDQETVYNYCDLYQQGIELPPVSCVFDGEKFWLWDGFHRLAAKAMADGWHSTIKAQVEQGTLRDAIKAALSANSCHGLRRTNADKRRAVTLALSDGEWQQWSSRRIADLCGVTHHLVNTLRQEIQLESNSSSSVLRRYIDRQGNEKEMNVANIGNGDMSPLVDEENKEPEFLDVDLEPPEEIEWFLQKTGNVPGVVIRDPYDSVLVPFSSIPELILFLANVNSHQ